MYKFNLFFVYMDHFVINNLKLWVINSLEIKKGFKILLIFN